MISVPARVCNPNVVGVRAQDDPVTVELGPDTDLPTDCEQCGQKLLLRAPGRTRCERCRLGRSRRAEDSGADDGAREQAAELPAVPCAGCHRTETEWNNRLALADGYCLTCRLNGAHLSTAAQPHPGHGLAG